ncbi:condensation domain-containing protein, partial [Streptomyces daliensis]
MTDLRSLLGELRHSGVQLWVHEGRLRVRPSNALTAEQSAALRASKQEVIALLQAEELSRSTPLRGRPRPTAVPLSLGQEGLWFLEQLGAPGAAYDLKSIVRITGPLDPEALDRALADLARRHEVLRTRYTTVEDVAAQVVDEEATLTAERLDLSGIPAGRREDALRELLRAPQRFDLEAAAPFRVRLIRLGDDAHVLAVHTHHIMIDGPSLDLFYTQLGSLYASFAAGERPTLPEPAAQYADYAVWQREWLRGDVLDEQLAYWKDALAGAPGTLGLPTDRPRPAEPTFAGDVVEFTVPPELTRALTALGREQDATLFMVLLAALKTLLARWSGQYDVSVGIPVDGRGHEDTEGLIGYFLNTLVLRSTLSSELPFAELVRGVRDRLVGAYDHRDLPFDRLVAELCPQRDLAHHPLFQTLFTFLAQDEIRWGDLRLDRMDPEDRTSKFDLSLFVSETGPDGGLECGFEYA